MIKLKEVERLTEISPFSEVYDFFCLLSRKGKEVGENVWEYLYEKKELYKSIPYKFPQIPQKELIKIFPEAVSFIKEKIDQLIKEEEEVIQEFKEELHSYWDLTSKLLLKDIYQMKLKKIEKEIRRLQNYLPDNFSTPEGKKILFNREVINRIKRNISIVDVFSEIFPEKILKKAGRNFVALCPFHQEKNLSFYIYPETNSFYCFGCGEKGDVIDLVMKVNGFSFNQAITFLKKIGG